MSKNKLRAQKFKAIARELADLKARDGGVTLNDVTWMARSGELLAPSPVPLDDPDLSSHLYGPVMKTVQMQRIEVKELDENGRVVWEA